MLIVAVLAEFLRKLLFNIGPKCMAQINVFVETT